MISEEPYKRVKGVVAEGLNLGRTNEDIYRGTLTCGAERKFNGGMLICQGQKILAYKYFNPVSSVWTTKQSLTMLFEGCG